MSTVDLRSLQKRLRKATAALEERKREMERTQALLQPLHAEKEGLLLEQILKGESRIFRNPSALQESNPTKMPMGRERQLTFMARMVAQALKTGKGRNLFLCGKPGTGKTHALLHLLHVIRTRASKGAINLRPVYVNAGLTRNPYFTLMEILKQLGVAVPSSGWQMTRLKQEFERIVASAPILAAIDEVDAILFKEREPLVYYPNRLPNVTLILVSNRYEDLAGLPSRAKSSLQPIPVVFLSLHR